MYLQLIAGYTCADILSFKLRNVKLFLMESWSQCQNSPENLPVFKLFETINNMENKYP